HFFPKPSAVLPEERLPIRGTKQGEQALIAANHDRAAFIEDRQQVAQRAAATLRVRQRAPQFTRMQGVDARLGARKGEPGEGVEPVVQALRAGRDAPRLEDADLVVRVL